MIGMSGHMVQLCRSVAETKGNFSLGLVNFYNFNIAREHKMYECFFVYNDIKLISLV